MEYLFSLKNKNLSNETCLLRVDFNVQDNELKDSLRIKKSLPTIKFLVDRGAKVVILSHRGRPQKVSSIKYQVSSYTLKPFAKILSQKLRQKINFINHFDFQKIRKEIKKSEKSGIFLLENLRFLAGEEKNDVKLAKQLASLGTVYVNDAFGVDHRQNASVSAITKFLPSYAGLLLENEIENLSSVINNPKKPLAVILGGAKVSNKIGLIKNFLKAADYFLIGGGIANTFIAAQGLPIGESLCEEKMIPTAKKFLKSKKIILPVDLIINNGKILDIGPETIKKYSEIIKNAKTIIWNGPLGLIEDKRFKNGSMEIAKAIIKSDGLSVIGGGETTSLVSNIPEAEQVRYGAGKYQVSSRIFLSTGGGAMLEYLAGKKLPGIAALNNKKTKKLKNKKL